VIGEIIMKCANFHQRHTFASSAVSHAEDVMMSGRRDIGHRDFEFVFDYHLQFKLHFALNFKRYGTVDVTEADQALDR